MSVETAAADQVTLTGLVDPGYVGLYVFVMFKTKDSCFQRREKD